MLNDGNKIDFYKYKLTGDLTVQRIAHRNPHERFPQAEQKTKG